MLGLLCKNQYPKGISKGDKANLRCKCKNFKFDCGVLYFKRVKKGEGEEDGRKICFRTEDEKRHILMSCHAGIEKYNLFSMVVVYLYVYTCRKQLRQI